MSSLSRSPTDVKDLEYEHENRNSVLTIRRQCSVPGGTAKEAFAGSRSQETLLSQPKPSASGGIVLLRLYVKHRRTRSSSRRRCPNTTKETQKNF